MKTLVSRKNVDFYVRIVIAIVCQVFDLLPPVLFCFHGKIITASIKIGTNISCFHEKYYWSLIHSSRWNSVDVTKKWFVCYINWTVISRIYEFKKIFLNIVSCYSSKIRWIHEKKNQFTLFFFKILGCRDPRCKHEYLDSPRRIR